MEKDLKNKSNLFWKEKLTPEQYEVTREGKTEKAGTGKFLHNKKAGTYTCSCCGTPLFKSETKYESCTGWPSFFDAKLENLEILEDKSTFRKRMEVKCSNCDAHLGHVFDDGPDPTGKRYCMNSVALSFIEDK